MRCEKVQEIELQEQLNLGLDYYQIEFIYLCLLTLFFSSDFNLRQALLMRYQMVLAGPDLYPHGFTTLWKESCCFPTILAEDWP